ncbi:hypothetical protein LZ30DRAFT_275586 [Colletotrichum cereale]|nr:hypothetical protein LZ30DRAFT_275586 [Colletotrichum cereale]
MVRAVHLSRTASPCSGHLLNQALADGASISCAAGASIADFHFSCAWRDVSGQRRNGRNKPDLAFRVLSRHAKLQSSRWIAARPNLPGQTFEANGLLMGYHRSPYSLLRTTSRRRPTALYSPVAVSAMYKMLWPRDDSWTGCLSVPCPQRASPRVLFLSS